MPFGDRLAAAVARASRRSSSGIDPDPRSSGRTRSRRWPSRARGSSLALADVERSAALDLGAAAAPPGSRPPPPCSRHCLALVDAAGPACVAVKPQLACFERLGFAGWLALEATCRARARAAACSSSPTASAATSPSTARGLRAGAARRPRRRRSAAARASAPTRSPRTRCSARDALAPFVAAARAAGAGRVRARPHVQPGRRRLVRRRARRRRAAVGAARRRGRRGRHAGPGVRARRRRRGVRRHGARSTSRACAS